MKLKSLNLMLNGMIIFILAFTIGCGGQGTKQKDESKKEPSEIERTLVTDPNGVVLTINGMDVTKKELDEAVAKIQYPENYTYYGAIYTYFIPENILKGEFENEKKQLLDEVNGIMAKVKSGEITFEEAIEKYGDYPGDDEQFKNHKSYYMKNIANTPFMVIDRVLRSLKEGEISEPFFTAYGINVVKLDKQHKDYYGNVFAYDFYHFMITFERFLKDGESIEKFYNRKMSTMKVDILDKSFAKDFPHLAALGHEGEDAQKAYDEAVKMPKPDYDWKTLPPDTVLFIMNGTKVTKKELDDVEKEYKIPQRDIYNAAIQSFFLKSRAVMGYYKKYHDEIFKELKQIKSDIEKGKMTFEEAQQKYSTDPGMKENQGLYAGIPRDMFVKEFEDVAFNIPLNQISEPFLTQYGGHILMVVGETKDENGNRKTIDVRHILIGFEKYYAKEKGLTYEELQEKMKDPMFDYTADAMKNLDVVIHDAFLYSILPNLGQAPEMPQMVKEETVKVEEQSKEGQ